MSLVLTERELTFQSKARKFARDYIAPVAEKIETEGVFPFEILSKMGQQGLLGAPFPRRDGGTGLGWAHEVIVAEGVSAVSAAAEMARLASAALYAAPLAYFGSKEQKKEFLTPVLSGKRIGALALTEPDCGQ